MTSVRRTTKSVAEKAKHVKISERGISELLAGQLSEEKVKALDLSKWDEADHFSKGDDLSVQYMLVVDAINFCFWPDGVLEYEHISGNLKVRSETSKAKQSNAPLPVVCFLSACVYVRVCER